MKLWFLFNFAKILKSCHFVVGGPKNFKLLLDISFDSGFQRIVLSSLLLFPCTCYEFDLDDIHWSKVTTLMARNFNHSWPLYFNFWNMINLCPYICFIKNSKCQQYLFWRKSRQKTQMFHFLKDHYFAVVALLIWMLVCFERLLWAF